MSRVVVINHLTLDGVMQAPGRPDEDLRGGFAHRGWARPRGDSAGVAAAGIAEAGALLLGRRTYEDFFSVWPNQTDNPFADPSARPGDGTAALRGGQPDDSAPPRRHQDDEQRRGDRDLPAGQGDGGQDHLGPIGRRQRAHCRRMKIES